MFDHHLHNAKLQLIILPLFLPQSDLYNYNPQPVDMTNLTLSREMQNMAERLAENAHDIWAKRKVDELEACGE